MAKWRLTPDCKMLFATRWQRNGVCHQMAKWRLTPDGIEDKERKGQETEAQAVPKKEHELFIDEQQSESNTEEEEE
jgi:hypothetical protein